MRHLEHAALAGHVLQRGFLAGVGHVLAEHDDARVVRHLVLHRTVDGGNHGVGLALGLRHGVECRRCRIDIRRKHIPVGGLDARLGRRQCGSGRLGDLAIDVRTDGLEVGVGEQALAQEKLFHPRNRVATCLSLALVRRLVQPLIV
jgi:hypothetical protein